jgi:hypothetical protein
MINYFYKIKAKVGSKFNLIHNPNFEFNSLLHLSLRTYTMLIWFCMFFYNLLHISILTKIQHFSTYSNCCSIFLGGFLYWFSACLSNVRRAQLATQDNEILMNATSKKKKLLYDKKHYFLKIICLGLKLFIMKSIVCLHHVN